MDEVAQIRKEMDDKEPVMKALRKIGEGIQSKCHHLAEQPMKYWLKVLQTRWDEVSNAVDARRDDLDKVKLFVCRRRLVHKLLDK